MKIKFVFFGTDDFSVAVLDGLKKAGLLPALVVTQPDRPKGRGLELTPPPAKLWALENKTDYLQPEILDSSFNLQLTTYNLQLFVVASYGLIIPKHILDIPKCGTLNVHPSLLPKYRGATPIESQILNDEKEIGVTIMLIDEQMDHGPLLAQRKVPLSVIPARFAGASARRAKAGIQIPSAIELKKKLAEEGGKLLAQVIPRWIAGEIQPAPQDHSKATYTKKFTKTDGEIDLSGDPYKNFLRIQAFADSIGTYFFASNSPFPKPTHQIAAIWGVGKGSTRVSEGEGFSPFPKSSAVSERGTSFRKGGMGNKNIRVLIKSAEFRDDALRILRIIPEGRREMSYEEFLRGIKLK